MTTARINIGHFGNGELVYYPRRYPPLNEEHLLDRSGQPTALSARLNREILPAINPTGRLWLNVNIDFGVAVGYTTCVAVPEADAQGSLFSAFAAKRVIHKHNGPCLNRFVGGSRTEEPTNFICLRLRREPYGNAYRLLEIRPGEWWWEPWHEAAANDESMKDICTQFWLNHAVALQDAGPVICMGCHTILNARSREPGALPYQCGNAIICSACAEKQKHLGWEGFSMVDLPGWGLLYMPMCTPRPQLLI